MGLLRAASTVLPDGTTMEIASIQDIPMYNGDLEANKGIPASVAQLAIKIQQADAVLFAVPEHNFAVSAALKNTIDWISRCPENPWNFKPVAVMGAGGGSGASKAMFNFRHSGLFNKMLILNKPQVHVNAFAPDTFDADSGDVMRGSVKIEIRALLYSLTTWTVLHQRKKLKSPFFKRLFKHTPIQHVVGISGSLRQASANSGLLRTAQQVLPAHMALDIVSIHELPLFEEGLPPTAAVVAFVNKVRAAEAIVFACPEYNFSMTGVLKNALEWAGHWDALDGKPALIMGAGGGLGTARAQMQLRQAGISLNLHFLPAPLLELNAFEEGNFDATTGDLISEKWKERLSEALTLLQQWTLRINFGATEEELPTADASLAAGDYPSEVIPAAAAVGDVWTEGKKRVVVLNGSLVDHSSVSGLSNAVAEGGFDGAQVQIARIKGIPLYNGDVEAKEGFPVAVQNFADLVKSADVLVFCAGETHFGVPAALKNALDWASRIPDTFQDKTASILGSGKSGNAVHAMHQLRQMGVFLKLNFINSNDVQVADTPNISTATAEQIQANVDALLEHQALLTKKRPDNSHTSIKLLVLPGSIRQASANMGLVRVAMGKSYKGVELELAEIAEIPMYSQDTEAAGFPPQVEQLVAQVKAADGVLIVSPEYNFNFTPLLKNAIDWASRKEAFRGKAGAIIGTGGGNGSVRSHDQLRYSSVFLNLHLLNGPSVTIQEFSPGTTDLATGDLLDATQHEKVFSVVESLRDFAGQLKVHG